LSLEDVYDVTRIRRPILVAIEEENPKQLPADVFLKGMLLIYARFLEVHDPEELVQGYMARLIAKREWMD
jgi:cytoskeletal protein RodZ